MTWDRQKLACPVEGCRHRELMLAPLSDGDYEFVRCPDHGIQYPHPNVSVPDYLMHEFLDFVRTKPHNRGVARKLVFRFRQWLDFAEEFMGSHRRREEYEDEICLGENDA